MDKLRYTGKNIACAIFGVAGLLLLSGCATTTKTTPQCELNVSVVQEIQKQAEAGEKDAQYRVASWYQVGRCLDQNHSIASEWFLRAAKQGHIDAQNELAVRYLREGDLDRAIEWYRKAGEQGHVKSQLSLASLYRYLEDFDSAIYWYKKAGEAGDLMASRTAGDLYRDKKNDIDNAIIWFQKASELGDFVSAWYLGNIYYHGQSGIKQDPEKAEKWFSLGAEMGDYQSEVVLKKIQQKRDPEWQLEQKRLAEEKAAEAIREFLLLKEKAEQGDREAQYKLGKIYSSGSERIEKDLTQAVNWIKKSADQGYLAAEIYMIAKKNKSIDKLIGIWEGEFRGSGSYLTGPAKLQIEEKKNEVYTGRVLEFTHHSLSCKGAEVKMLRVNGRRFSINFKHGSLCNAEGELQYGSEAFKGSIVFQRRNRKATLVLAKVSIDPNLNGYPDNWPPTTNSDDIEDRISGKYICQGIGITFYSIMKNTRLKDQRFPACEYFEFERVNDGELRLRLWSESGKRIYERALVNGKDYSIKNGWIQLISSSTWDFGAEGGFAAWGGTERETSYIGLTVNNDIVAKTINIISGVVVLYVIPIPVGYENPPEWGLFERL